MADLTKDLLFNIILLLLFHIMLFLDSHLQSDIKMHQNSLKGSSCVSTKDV